MQNFNTDQAITMARDWAYIAYREALLLDGFEYKAKAAEHQRYTFLANKLAELNSIISDLQSKSSVSDHGLTTGENQNGPY